MAADRLKFRCYQCNQLLAAAPGKAGSIVSCPKCKAELLVPAPESSAVAEPDRRTRSEAAESVVTTPMPTKPAPVPTFLDEIGAAIPAEVADLRPEDLRVEAEFFESLTRAPEPAKKPEPFLSLAPQPTTPFPSLVPGAAAAPVPSTAEIASLLRPSQASSLRTEPAGMVARLAETPLPLVAESTDAPPIEIEPPTILPPGTEIRPIREVVLPAAVVMAWSLFGLIGIAVSFIAGLMIGHYLWVTH